MTTYTYYPKGTCSKQMEVDLEDGVIKDVRVLGGCNGNFKPTSCPDQLSIALEKALEKEKNAK